jgi:hypothetical protein
MAGCWGRPPPEIDRTLRFADVRRHLIAVSRHPRLRPPGTFRWCWRGRARPPRFNGRRPHGELVAAFPGRFLALPVLGGPLAVRTGQAVYPAGGNAGLVDRLAPVLASLSETVRRYDTAPLATTAKLAANLLLLSEVVALAESFAVGRSGASPTTSYASSWARVPCSRPG